ncbi:MAG: hypothetical protein ACREUC_23260, partial [Steroidobacteraceae bacterium]
MTENAGFRRVACLDDDGTPVADRGLALRPTAGAATLGHHMRFDSSRPQFEPGHPALLAHTLRQSGRDGSRRVLLLTSGLGLGHVRA